MSKDKEPAPIQWHPIFAKVLRLLVQEHYDVQTNVPVGDVPREADILLLRRTSQGRQPFHGLWRHLTTWNIVEFKGRKSSARVGDLPLLVELGLGIHRRLNEERVRAGESLLSAQETAFWYVANELGRRFLRDSEQRLGALEKVTNGVWRCQILRHLVFLVSSVAVPVEYDTTPLHLVARESAETERVLAEVIVNEPGLWEMYNHFLSYLHPEIWEEAIRMARTKNKVKTSADGTSMQPLIDTYGMEAIVKAMGGAQEVIKAIGVDEFLAQLTPEQKRAMMERLVKEG